MLSNYLPEYKGAIEGYVVNYLSRHLWKVRPLYDHEDAMQEAYEVFMRCCAKYPIIDTPQHFMALFKTAWARHFVDLAAKASEARAEFSASGVRLRDGQEEEDDLIGGIVGELDNDGALAVMIRQAPEEVVMVLNLLLNAPQELLDLAMKTWRMQGRYREDGDAAIARMLGRPVGSTPMTDTHNYFSPKR